MNLTPRLVAKLLTQSYQLGVNATANYLSANPPDLTDDPDFLAINPQFKGMKLANPVADMLVPESLSGTTALLWQADRLGSRCGRIPVWPARPMGHADQPLLPGDGPESGRLPRIDPYCETYTTGPAPLCTLDAHPYALDMHDAARAASRGDSLAHSAWNPNSTPPAYGKCSAWS